MLSAKLTKQAFLKLIDKYNHANDGVKHGTLFELSDTCVAIAMNINTMLNSYIRNDTKNMIIQSVPRRERINDRVKATFQACHYAHDIFRPSCPLKIFA